MWFVGKFKLMTLSSLLKGEGISMRSVSMLISESGGVKWFGVHSETPLVCTCRVKKRGVGLNVVLRLSGLPAESRFPINVVALKRKCDFL